VHGIWLRYGPACLYPAKLCARFFRPGAVRRTLLAAARSGREAAGPRGKGRAAAQPGHRRGGGGDAVRHGLPRSRQVSSAGRGGRRRGLPAAGFPEERGTVTLRAVSAPGGDSGLRGGGAHPAFPRGPWPCCPRKLPPRVPWRCEMSPLGLDPAPTSLRVKTQFLLGS